MITLSTFMSAVKPRERTDQYLILAAMFVLNAYVAPVAAKQISDLLNLQLGARAPDNVPASLRKYQAYAAPVEKGPPLKWSLTDSGLNQLRQISGLGLISAPDGKDFRSDVAILCALEFPELRALLKAFGGDTAWKEVGDRRHTHIYRECSLPTRDGKKLRIISTTSTSMGLTAAAIATTHLILEFRPRLVLMVGIAAGTHSGGKQFGDILVADPSVDYNSGKVALQNGIREFQPDPYPIGLNPRLRTILQKYRDAQEVFSGLQDRWDRNKPLATNRLHLGPVGAADQVIDDPERVIEIQKNWRKLIGVEMETYAVYRAVHEAPEPRPRVASFKAVCDFAAEKSDSWQEYAAFMAAEFACEFLRREWSNLWPQG